VTVLASALPGPGQRVGAQEMQLLPALVGGATGLAAGGYVAIGIVTAQARRGRYLYSSEDALGWHATPILVGPGVGFLIGLFDQERLRRTVIGGAAGGIVGTGIGWLAGLHFWLSPEGKWAGGVIGGAAGLLAGSLVGALWPAPDEAQATAAAAAGLRGLPIGVRISF
jgi:hypothetical protein